MYPDVHSDTAMESQKALEDKDVDFEIEEEGREESDNQERVPDSLSKLESCTITFTGSTKKDDTGALIIPCLAHCSQSGQSTDYSSNEELRSVQGHSHEEPLPRHDRDESCLANNFERLGHPRTREATLGGESCTGRRRETARDKKYIIRPPLDIIPMAVYFPTYWIHLRYELGLCVRFWSADLHNRDWRQVFGACYFPKFLNPTQLFIIRVTLTLIAFGTELAAQIDGLSAFGWPMFLYFTSANALMILVYFVLISILSFRAVRSFHKPLYSEVLDNTDTFESNLDTVSPRNIVDLSEARSLQVTPPAEQIDISSSNMTNLHIGNKCFRASSTKLGRRCLCAMRTLQIPGYTDLLADPMFCVDGIILAPNPSYPKTGKCFSAFCSRRHQNANMEAVMPNDVEQSEVVCKTEAPFLVNFAWVLHSMQLVGSLSVIVFFFALFRINESQFPETWYSVWRHIVIICFTLTHSLILSRIPFPIRHTLYVLGVAFSYLFLQVLVFILDLSNADGDTGCVYRVLNLKYPLSAALICVMALAGLLLFTLTIWSILRGRLLLVDPPPTVSVPASRVEKAKIEQAVATGFPRSKSFFCCLRSNTSWTNRANTETSGR